MTQQPQNIIIRKADISDAKTMALLHIAEIKGGLFSFLGPAFVSGVYKTLLELKDSTALIAQEGNSTVGFICGVADTNTFFKRHLIKRGLISAFYSLPHLFRFSRARMIFCAVRYPVKFEQDLPPAELLSMAVHQQHHGEGIGSLLFNKFSDEMQRKRINNFRIVTDELNVPAQKFYENLRCREACRKEAFAGGKIVVFVWP